MEGKLVQQILKMTMSLQLTQGNCYIPHFFFITSSEALGAYADGYISLILPEDFTVYNTAFILVYCVQFRIIFGEARLLNTVITFSDETIVPVFPPLPPLVDQSVSSTFFSVLMIPSLSPPLSIPLSNRCHLRYQWTVNSWAMMSPWAGWSTTNKMN